MNSRTIVIVIVAGFALCCIGSGAIMTLSAIEKAMASAKSPDAPIAVAPKPDEKDDDDDAPVAPPATTDDTPDDDETIPTSNKPGDDGEAPEYVAPEEGSSTFAVYYAKKSKLPGGSALTLAVKGTTLTAIKNEEQLEEADAPFVSFEEQSTFEFPVSEEGLQASALDPASRKLLTGSQTVTVLTVITSGLPEEERDAQKAVLAFAKATGGVVWDDDSGEFLNVGEFKTKRLDTWEGDVPKAERFYSVVQNPGEKTVDLATRGLKRFALPELELHDVAKDELQQAVVFLSVVAQTIVENQDAPLTPATELKVSVADLKHEGFRKQIEPSVGSSGGVSVLHFKSAGDEEMPALLLVLPPGGVKAFFGN